jgi:hypothetical protein
MDEKKEKGIDPWERRSHSSRSFQFTARMVAVVKI